MAGWLDYVADVSTMMRDCEQELFPERRKDDNRETKGEQ